MPQRRLKLIINPISGNGKKKGLAEKLTKRLSKMGFDVDVEYTTCRGDATTIAKRAVQAGNYYGVLACGGDGTVNETARALCDTGVPLGIIPAGSGNGLARHIGVPIDPISSLKVIAADNIVDCDYCTANGEKFFCTFGVGFDAAVSTRFSKKPNRGKWNYIKSVFEEFHSYKSRDYRITIDGKTIDDNAFLITVANASQYGNNAFIAPQASLTDGLLDVVVVHRAGDLRTALVGLDMMTGFINHSKLVTTYRTPSVTIERANGGEAHIDGEPIEMPAKIDIECHKHGIRLFCPLGKFPLIPVVAPTYFALKDWGILLSKTIRR